EMERAHATRIVAPGSVLSCNTRLSQMYDIMVPPAVKGVPRSTYSRLGSVSIGAAGDTYLPLVLLEPISPLVDTHPGDKQSLVIFFDKSKVVRQYTVSSSKVDVSQGLITR